MVRAAHSASFVRLVAALPVVSVAPALSQTCVDCCTGSGAVPDAWCLPINGCPTSGQCVNGRVTCVISTGTFACSECGAGGTRQCSPSSTGTCRPQTPRTETCNLCDDNANGVVDEGLNGVSCTTASGCNGTSSCSGGVGGCNLTASSRLPCAACAQGSQQCQAGTCGGQIDEGECLVSTNCACAPKTCAQVPCGSPQPDGSRTCGTGACGRIHDGCGGMLDCGNCKSGELCGLSTPNQCDICVTDCSLFVDRGLPVLRKRDQLV